MVNSARPCAATSGPPMSFPHRAFTGGAGVDETKAYVPSNAVVPFESAWVCAPAAATKLKIPPALCATSRVLTASHWSKVQGRRVTGFTNGEEAAVHLTEVVPFLVEDELKRLGGLYEKAANWVPFVVTDGRLVTGQNPASSRPGAEALLQLLV